MESMFIEIDKQLLGTKKHVIVGVVYRPPNTCMNAFNDSMSIILDKIGQENKLAYILGDYNINLLNAESHNQTGNFTEILFSHEYLPLITRPTRITQNSATLIDNILTNNHEKINTSFNGILMSNIFA